MKLTSRLLSLSLLAIAALASFPQVAQALPKDCGKTFTLDGETYCVKVQTASDEGAVLDVVSPLPEGVKGLEYRQYRVLASCRNALKPPKPNTIILIESRQVNPSGKVVNRSTLNSTLSADSWGGQLGWKAFQVSCGKG
jgi:hypothetical protein